MINEFPLENYGSISEDHLKEMQPSGYTQFSWAFDNFISNENPTIAGYNLYRYYHEDSDPVDKETWETMYSRPNTKWFDGMTHYQAQTVADEQDYQEKLQWAMGPDGYTLSSVMGGLAGSLFDPLNFLPWTRLMGASMKVANIGKTLARGAGDAAIGAAVGEVPIYHNKKATQVEYDLTTSLMNVAFAGALGATVAGMGAVVKKLRGQDVQETSFAAGKAMDDIASGKNGAEIEGSRPPDKNIDVLKSIENSLEEYKEVAQREIRSLADQEEVKIVADKMKTTPKAVLDYITCKST